jgi:hypothetical protein
MGESGLLIFAERDLARFGDYPFDEAIERRDWIWNSG